MSDNLDRLLAEIADATSGRIEPPGADAARRRGRQRTARRRLTVGALALALAAGGTGIAAVAGQNTAGVRPATGTSPTSSASSGTPGPSATATATGTPVAVDLNAVVNSAWAPPGQLPFEDGAQWRQTLPARPSIEVGNTEVFYATCTGFPAGAVGFQEVIYNTRALSPYPFDGGAGGYLARQTLFFFPTAAAAHAALETVVSGYAHCPPLYGPATPKLVSTVVPTGQIQDGYAWLHTYRQPSGGQQARYPWTPDVHEYFVQRGNVLTLADVEGGEAFDSTSQDRQFLVTLAAHLSVYGN